MSKSPVTCGSASISLFKGAVLGMAVMGYYLLLKAITQPSGTGDMKGMNHLGYNMVIALMAAVVPLLALVGVFVGLVGTRGDGRCRAWWGVSFNGFILLLAGYAYALARH
jgi:hypothetical protein